MCFLPDGLPCVQRQPESFIFYQIRPFSASFRGQFSKKMVFSRKELTDLGISCIIVFVLAGMAELADALDSGSSESNFMQVQVLFPAPRLSIVLSLFFYFIRFYI